jgi:hypothetical protein
MHLITLITLICDGVRKYFTAKWIIKKNDMMLACNLFLAAVGSHLFGVARQCPPAAVSDVVSVL